MMSLGPHSEGKSIRWWCGEESPGVTGRDWRVPIPGGMVAFRWDPGRLTCRRGDGVMNFFLGEKPDFRETRRKA